MDRRRCRAAAGCVFHRRHVAGEFGEAKHRRQARQRLTFGFRSDNLIGPENGGFAGIVRNFNGERLGMAQQAAAYARLCYEDALDWARQRHTFGFRSDSPQAGCGEAIHSEDGRRSKAFDRRPQAQH